MYYRTVILIRPDLALNCVGTALFGLELLVLTVQGVYFRDRWPATMYILAAALETAGYGCRIALHSSFGISPLVVQGVFLALAPSFISAGLYMHFAKYVVAHSERNYFRRSGHSFVTMLVVFEFGARILQIVGAAIMPQRVDLYEPGRWLLLAGMALQLAVILVFLVLGAIKISRIFHDPSVWEYEFREIRSQFVFKLIPSVVVVSAVFIIIRLVYRIVMLGTNPLGRLAGERYFLSLDGLMIVLSLVPICLFYPGRAVSSVYLLKNKQLKRKRHEKQEEGPMLVD